MVNIKKSLDEGIENLEKGFVNQVKTNVRAVAGQMGANASSSHQAQQSPSDSGTNESGQHAPQQGNPQSDQMTQEEVAAFYAPSNPHEKHGLSPVEKNDKDAKEPSGFFKKQLREGKTPEEAAKLEGLRMKLHKEYFEKLIDRKSLAQEHKEEEEEKKEEKKMEELHIEEKKKKDDDVALRQAQQKTEKFPGASG